MSKELKNSESAEEKKTKVPLVSEEIPAARGPSVTIHACGGCGINLARRFCAEGVPKSINIVRFDTAGANVRPGEDYINLGDGSGSGAIRSAHASGVNLKLTKLSDDEIKLADINIIMFSMAGGSGSVIGPLLAREVERRRGKAVVMAVTDDSSWIWANNSRNTLRSLSAIANDSKIYLPISVFVNRNSTRETTDAIFSQRLRQLVDLMVLPTRELDKADRKNFFNGTQTSGAAPGIRILHVIGEVDGDDHLDPASIEVWPKDGDAYSDSVLSIGIVPSSQDYSPPIFVDRRTEAVVRYEGSFADRTMSPLLATISHDDVALAELIQELDQTCRRFESQGRSPSVISFEGKETDAKTGLIL